MGKHKNKEQCAIFLNFVELHPDLARNFAKGDRVAHEEIWADLTKALNASGPPVKEVSVWKKSWTDWRLNIKSRLAHNKEATRKTGSGRFNNYVLTDVEERIAVLCGLYTSVDGIPKAKSHGVRIKENAATDKENLLSTSSLHRSPMHTIMEQLFEENPPSSTSVSALHPSTSPIPATSKVTNKKRCAVDISDVIDLERNNFKILFEKVDNIAKEVKDMNRNLREMRRIKDKELQEVKRHHFVIEKNLQTRNELKLQFLEIEQMKLQLPRT